MEILIWLNHNMALIKNFRNCVYQKTAPMFYKSIENSDLNKIKSSTKFPLKAQTSMQPQNRPQFHSKKLIKRLRKTAFSPKHALSPFDYQSLKLCNDPKHAKFWIWDKYNILLPQNQLKMDFLVTGQQMKNPLLNIYSDKGKNSLNFSVKHFKEPKRTTSTEKQKPNLHSKCENFGTQQRRWLRYLPHSRH